MRERGKGTEPSVDERYTQWKSLVPVLYDWLANHNLVWPSLSCRWGPQLEQATYKNRQRLYLSEQTDGSVPNTLVIANCEVVKPRVAAAEHISQFNEEARSPFVKKYKTIIHPGEVNRIRELPQNSKIVATHTDSPDVLIWDVEAQPNRHAVLGATNSRPDLILTGHQDNAEFALAMCPTEPFVLSGGKDKSVVLWSIHDHISTLAADTGATKSPGSGGTIIKHASKVGGSNDKPVDSPSIGPRGIYQGHDDTVEDVQFCPSSAQEFCSVGDDSCLILWDARVGSTPVAKVEKAHDADLHCVDWNPHDVNFILTGSADATVRMFDRRNLTSGDVGSPVHKFEGHSAAVLCVQWSPDKSSVFGSSAEDGILNIWDHEKVGKKQDSVGSRMPIFPPGLFFRHAGHRDKVVDFHWNASDPWTIVSVSDDCESTGGGGTLQIWRMIDLIYRPEEEVVAELDKFKSHYLLAPTLSSSSSSLPALFANCPTSHMFQPGAYTILNRFGTFVYKGAVFAAVGLAAGLVGTALSNGLINLRKKMEPDFETPNKAPPTLLNALTWAIHMGVSSNFRYQTLNGIEFLLEKGLSPLAFKSSVVVLRCLNNVLGGMSFVILARLTGAQSVGEPKPVAEGEAGSVSEKEKLIDGAEDFQSNQSTYK